MSFPLVPAPDAVVEMVRRLHCDNESVVEQGIRWIPARWKTPKLSDYAPLIGRIMEHTDPSDVRGEHIIRRRHVFEQENDALALFMAAMIWGFGVRGYGPERVGSVVQEAGAELRGKLEGLVGAARTGPSEAWEALTHTSKLRGLGPAFATKVAYFAAFSVDAVEPRPLIADANTSWAMWDLVRLSRSGERCDSYLTYVSLAHGWAEDHGWRPDDIEWALFEIGKDVPRFVT